jgi:plasmid stabilization system protein ParE
MNKLAISPAARQDLEEIKAYISDDLENPTAALNVVARIVQSLKKLPDMPNMGTPLFSKVAF